MYKVLSFSLLSVGLVFSGSSSSSSSSDDKSSGGSSSPTPGLDGSYQFTALDVQYQINVCTNSDGETYMSMNKVENGCAEEDYIMGVFRDLNGPQQIDDDEYALIMAGYQRQLPSGIGFDAMTYRIICDTENENECKLSRGNGAETYDLETISATPLVNCYEPGGSFTTDISYPIMYRSVNIGCMLGISEAYEEQSINNAALTDACYIIIDGSDNPIEGGLVGQPLEATAELKWGNTLSLETYLNEAKADGEVDRRGSGITVLDPNSQTGGIIYSWRNEEGTFGGVYAFEPTGGAVDACPIFTPAP